MDIVTTNDNQIELTLPMQVAKLVVATTVAFIAGKAAESAFDKVIVARTNKTTEIN